MATYTEFGPDVPLSELPPAFAACLPPAASSTDCDQIVGSSAAKLGYCSCDCADGEDRCPAMCGGQSYARMTYCACVNNSSTCPQLSSASCANSAFAYRPWFWSNAESGETYNEMCENTPICINILDVEGDQDVVKDLTQQCGTFQTVQIIVGTNPVLAAVAFLLVLVIVGLLLAPTDRPESRVPPPPPPGLLAYFAAPRSPEGGPRR